MSPTKSNPAPAPATETSAARTAAPRGGVRPWLYSLARNLPIIVLIALMVPLGKYLENPDHLGEYAFHVLMLAGINIILAVSLQLINGVSGQFSLGHAGFMAIGAYLAGYSSSTYAPDFEDPYTLVLFFGALAVVVAGVAAILYGLFVLMRLTRKLHPVVPAILLIALLGWIVGDISAASNLEEGKAIPYSLVWSKFFDLTQQGFNAAIEHGQPHTQAWATHLPDAAKGPICFVVLLLGGGIFAAIAGFIVGLPTLRLKGDYLAIATLGFGEIIRVLITNSDPLGGPRGLTSIPPYTNFAWLFGCAIVATVAIWRLAKSPKGKGIAAVREDELAAAAMGLDTTHHKVVAFVVGAFWAGVAGVLYAHLDGAIFPSMSGMMKSIEIVVMVTLGGLGSIAGAIIAAIVLTLLPEVLRGMSEWRMVIYSLLLIVLMLAKGKGWLAAPGAWLGRMWRRRRGPAATTPVASVPTGGEKP